MNQKKRLGKDPFENQAEAAMPKNNPEDAATADIEVKVSRQRKSSNPKPDKPQNPGLEVTSTELQKIRLEMNVLAEKLGKLEEEVVKAQSLQQELGEQQAQVMNLRRELGEQQSQVKSLKQELGEQQAQVQTIKSDWDIFHRKTERSLAMFSQPWRFWFPFLY